MLFSSKCIFHSCHKCNIIEGFVAFFFLNFMKKTQHHIKTYHNTYKLKKNCSDTGLLGLGLGLGLGLRETIPHEPNKQEEKNIL